MREVVSKYSARVVRSKEELEFLEDLHKNRAFQYIGLESPTDYATDDERLSWIELLPVIEGLKSSLLEHVVGHEGFTGTELNDFFHAVYDNDVMAAVSGSRFASLTKVPTELPEERYSEYLDITFFCQIGIEDTKKSMKAKGFNDNGFSNLEALYLDDSRSDLDQKLDIEEKKFFKHLDDSVAAGRLEREVAMAYRRLLAPCKRARSYERDKKFVEKMVNDLPVGSGVIFRGVAHRWSVIDEFNKQCNSSNESGDAEELERVMPEPSESSH